jgi:ribosomal protein L29
MAVIRKSELQKMNDAEKAAKIAELERAVLELRGEGRGDKAKSLKKAIARLKTPRPAHSPGKK